MFWIIIGVMVVVFVIMFVRVKDGRLTIYWGLFDVLLLQAEGISQELLAFDLTVLVDAAQQAWIVTIATVMLLIARLRKKIKEALQDDSGHVGL